MVLRDSFKKQLLLFLALGLDYWDSHLSYSAYKYRLYFRRIKPSSIYKTVSRLLSVGDIEKITKNGDVYLRLTSQGNERINQDIPLFRFFNKRWDGYWRIVIFDIPEEDKKLRDALRYKLTELGFGQWQRSVYITPFDLEEEMNQFLKINELFGFVFCIRGRRLGRGDDKEVARYAFKLDELDQEYTDFIDDETSNIIIKANNNKLKEKDIKDYVESYFRLILKEPGLPKELMPEDWSADLAKKEFKDTMIKIQKYVRDKPFKIKNK
jgi:phenylacetic acid degradation operon negative regulatory protein